MKPHGGTRIPAHVASTTLLLLSFLLMQIPLHAAEAVPPNQIDSIFSHLIAANTPGTAVLVIQKGRVIFQRGYGVTDLRRRTKINPQTNFRLASVTKQFTAMAIMLLVHDGKLRYDERLTDIFPDFPSYGNAITIRHLLNHTSGLPDYEELMDKASVGKLPRWTESHQITDS